jgi:phage terminase large subunit-like protein
MSIIPFVQWCEANIVLDNGERIKFEPHQKRILNRIFQLDKDGRLRYSTAIYSAVKKSGKTEILNCAGLYVGYELDPGGEVICSANSQEQSVGRVFRCMKRTIKKNPALKSQVESMTRTEITLKNGSLIKAIPSDDQSAAGANPSITLWDELWAFTLERDRRLYEELTPVPTRQNSMRLVATYAGYIGESDLLEGLYKAGQAGRKIWKTLPVWENGSLFCYWDHEPRMPWQDSKYYRAQRRELRPSAFDRMHRNLWVSAESSFIDMADYDACVDRDHKQIIGGYGLRFDPRRTPIWVGIDVATKHDCCAVVAVKKEDRRIKLVTHGLWQPSKRNPIDLERTVERWVLRLKGTFPLLTAFYDPYQFHRSATALREQGVRAEEFHQTEANLTEMSQNLYHLIKNQNLTLYHNPDLRKHIAQSVAKENPRGFRIVKSKASHKIDLAIALAMACLAATKSKLRRAGSYRPRHSRIRKSMLPGRTRGSLIRIRDHESGITREIR